MDAFFTNAPSRTVWIYKQSTGCMPPPENVMSGLKYGKMNKKTHKKRIFPFSGAIIRFNFE